MRFRIIGYISMLIMALLLQGALLSTPAQNANAEAISRIAVLKGAKPGSQATGFAKIYSQTGQNSYERFQVVATGLKPTTNYQLFANGVAFDTKKSNSNGSIEFVFSSNQNASLEGNVTPFPKGVTSAAEIQNFSLRESNMSVALIGSLKGESLSNETAPGSTLGLFNTITMEVGKSETILVPVTDPDGDPLTLTVSCDRGNFITVSGMNLVMSPQSADVGSHICVVTATDTFGLSTKIPFVVNVTPPNNAPQISPVADQIIKAGEVRDITVSATDAEGANGLRFFISSGPGFAFLTDRGDGTATLRLAPQVSDSAGGVVTVKVVDAGGLTDQTSFTVTVQSIVSIESVIRAKPNVFISGLGFGTAGAKVTINGKDLSSRVIGQTNVSITLKGSLKKLNLVHGANQISVSSGGLTSNTYVLNVLDGEE